MDINPNPAQNVAVDTNETFSEFSTRIHDKRVLPLLFDNGEPITLNPESKYCVMAFELTDFATQEQFAVLFGTIYQAIKGAEDAGAIPKDWCKNVATLFNLTPPEVPQRYLEEVPGAKVRITWKGEQRFLIEREEPEKEDE
jgi:hypothetical protein